VTLAGLTNNAAGYYFILAVSNVGYIIFNFLNLNAGWMHRVDSGHIPRPFRAPTWLIGLNTASRQRIVTVHKTGIGPQHKKQFAVLHDGDCRARNVCMLELQGH